MVKFSKSLLLAVPVVSSIKINRKTAEDCSSCPDEGTASCYLPGSNANAYIECSNGTPSYFTCPSGLIWNQELESCDWPTSDDSTQNDVQNHHHHHHKTWSVCSLCVFYPNAYGSCYMPSFNPRKYITCANGQAYSMSCPSGLVWQQRTETCNYPRGSGKRVRRGAIIEKLGEEICDSCVANEWGSCYLPGPTEHDYIECSNGLPSYKTCPNNLVWNQELETCDWPTDPPSNSSSNADGSAQKNLAPAQSKSFSLCSLCAFPINTNEYGSCYLPNILNPTTYFQCDNGEPVKLSCSPGLVWNQFKQTCDWPIWSSGRSKRSLGDIVQNIKNKVAENICDNCETNEWGTCFMAADDDVHAYYECTDGTPVRATCPAGLVWNQELETCDYAQ